MLKKCHESLFTFCKIMNVAANKKQNKVTKDHRYYGYGTTKKNKQNKLIKS